PPKPLHLPFHVEGEQAVESPAHNRSWPHLPRKNSPTAHPACARNGRKAPIRDPSMLSFLPRRNAVSTSPRTEGPARVKSYAPLVQLYAPRKALPQSRPGSIP